MSEHRLFVLLADYNAHANRELLAILAKAPPELLARAAGSYFETILGILNHLLVTDLAWLNSYRGSDRKFRALESAALDFQHPGWKKPLYDNLEALKARREAVDAALQAFAVELSDEMLAEQIVLADHRGQKHSFVLGEVLLHLFNHQTHHRGAIAQALDAAGVANDTSNLLALLLPR